MDFFRGDGADAALIIFAVGTDGERITHTHPQRKADVPGIRPGDADVRFIQLF